jgi:hypothetical protein
MRILASLLLAPLLCGAAAADEKSPAACEVGAEIPSFFVREVTGERPNLATCLVCRYGNRPVVLVSVRKLDAEGEKLIQAIDAAVDRGRGVGLKGFAVFIGEKPADIQPRLMALVRQRGVTLPLTIPIETDGPPVVRPPDGANLAVLCYCQRKIVATHLLPPGELTAASLDRVLADVRELTQ